MTVLITYPRHRIPRDLQDRLDLATAPIPPLYLPLRRLRAVPLSSQDRDCIARSDYLIVTSNFALSTLIDHILPSLDSAWRGTLIALSRKMEVSANAAGLRHVLVPDEENRHGLHRLLTTLMPTLPPDAVVTELCGNLHVPDSHEPSHKTDIDVPKIRIYENTWEPIDKQRAADEIRRSLAVGKAHDSTTDNDVRIDRIVVTSPSAYQRLQGIIAATPESFSKKITYYTLGPSTARIIAADHHPVILPTTNTNVLRQTLTQLLRALPPCPKPQCA
ncbi:uroporphyrinogen-III synthase [Bifidobacterium vansinderenii]|uniref:Uroporphyrinogen-III synthase HemD n=1 Tax=Bifidobacterium vansinderenii TaxID=1984871 RepID=A0A229VY29_9BIFI|nr:uroporphyrinogen-III synthase [Bifidobacterium vansinderenii]OXN00533.1 Uroporphyrinogen-III synthase HemD [Bifidobacterium vansinderenii]